MTETKGRKKYEARCKEPIEKKDCYIPGCYHALGECEGIPYSGKCASCRLKKNKAGMPRF